MTHLIEIENVNLEISSSDCGGYCSDSCYTSCDTGCSNGCFGSCGDNCGLIGEGDGCAL